MCFQESKCSWYPGFISKLSTWNLSKSIFYIWISTKKQVFNFFKRNSYTNACFKFLCDVKLRMSYFLISSKNLKTVYFRFHWFTDPWTRGFELVTREFKLVTREFELVTRGFELVTRWFELVTRWFELALLNLSFELITCNLQLVFYHITNTRTVTFLLHVNDLPNSSVLDQIMFADDTDLFLKIQI